MRLFLCEKPDIARAIAQALPTSTNKKDGHFVCGNDVLVWCYGHMLALYDFADYDPRFKQWVP